MKFESQKRTEPPLKKTRAYTKAQFINTTLSSLSHTSHNSTHTYVSTPTKKGSLSMETPSRKGKRAPRRQPTLYILFGVAVSFVRRRILRKCGFQPQTTSQHPTLSPCFFSSRRHNESGRGLRTVDAIALRKMFVLSYVESQCRANVAVCFWHFVYTDCSVLDISNINKITVQTNSAVS